MLTLPVMDDLRFGRAVRTVRVRRGWRQQDLADRAGVSRAVVSRIERGLADDMPSGHDPPGVRAARDSRRGARPEGGARSSTGWSTSATVSCTKRSRRSLGGAVPGLGHGPRGLVQHLGRARRDRPGPVASGYGARCSIIELKTEMVDLGELLATADRRTRLARDIVRDRGWDPATDLGLGHRRPITRDRAADRRAPDHASLGVAGRCHSDPIVASRPHRVDPWPHDRRRERGADPAGQGPSLITRSRARAPS